MTIILPPCLWESAPFSRLQALPMDAKPVVSWRSRDRAWANVAAGLRERIATMVTSESAAYVKPPFHTDAIRQQR